MTQPSCHRSATSCGRTPRCAYAAELAALAAADDRPRPPHWRLSPWAVVTYLMGGALADGTVITPEVHRVPAG